MHTRHGAASRAASARAGERADLPQVFKCGQEDSRKSAAWLVREHLAGAADRDCDHWHDDAGIMNHHIGITWQLEQSLNAIDSGVAAHYWDYTIDAKDYSKNDWWESPVFDAEWFGSPVTNNSDHIVSTGRWAYTSVKTHARGWSNITNPYGLLRSPWNTNPTPFLMRSRATYDHVSDGYDTFPTCSKFQTYAEETTLASMLFGLNGELHGPVHIMIGGHWSFDRFRWGDLSKGLEASDMFLLLSKFFWRQGYVHCPTYCSDDTPAEDCACSCPNHSKSWVVIEKVPEQA